MRQNAPPISHLAHPLSTLVFHYDRDAANICELLTLTSPVQGSAYGHPSLAPHTPPLTLRRSVKSIPEMVVLVSSSVFFQKQALYARFPNCRVLPLLLDWKDLSGEMLKEVTSLSLWPRLTRSADHGRRHGRRPALRERHHDDSTPVATASAPAIVRGVSEGAG